MVYPFWLLVLALRSLGEAVDQRGIEPRTSSLQMRHSTTELLALIEELNPDVSVGTPTALRVGATGPRVKL